MFFPQEPCPAGGFLGKRICSNVGASKRRIVGRTSHVAVLCGLSLKLASVLHHH